MLFSITKQSVIKTIPLSLRIIKWLFAILLFVCANAALAQLNNDLKAELSNHPKKIINRVELLAGPNFIYPKEKYDENRVAKFGYAFNLNLVHDFGKSPFNLNLKLGYEQKGWNSITYSSNTDFSPPAIQKFQRSETLNYLASSVFISRKFYRHHHNLSIGLGGYAGYLVNERMKYKLYLNDTLVSNFNGKPDSDQSFKRIDAGIIVLISYNLKVGRRILILRFENNHGLIDISQEENTAFKNRTYSFLIGISI